MRSWKIRDLYPQRFSTRLIWLSRQKEKSEGQSMPYLLNWYSNKQTTGPGLMIPLETWGRNGVGTHHKSTSQTGTHWPCQSSCNTPILLVKNPGTGESRFVQDLTAISEVVQGVHPSVPNPYTLLADLPGSSKYSTILDLKDVFFCIPLDHDSQEIFAFEWEDPDTQTSSLKNGAVL